jgi:hypothetical protein
MPFQLFTIPVSPLTIPLTERVEFAVFMALRRDNLYFHFGVAL